MSAQANTATETTFGRIDPRDALIAIRADNRRAGLSVSEADEIDMAQQIASAVRQDMATGRTFLVNGDGHTRSKLQDGALVNLTVADLIAALQATATPTSHTKPSAVPTTTGLNRTERAVAANAALRSTKTDAKASLAVDLVAKFGNPWVSGNRTHQAFVQNTNPTLATQLRSTAGR